MDHRFEKDGGLSFKVRVIPGAARSEIAGEHDGALRVRIAAPPVEGAANKELVRVLAKFLGLPKSAVEIVSGHASRLKRIRVNGEDARDLVQLFHDKRVASSGRSGR